MLIQINDIDFVNLTAVKRAFVDTFEGKVTVTIIFNDDSEDTFSGPDALALQAVLRQQATDARRLVKPKDGMRVVQGSLFEGTVQHP